MVYAFSSFFLVVLRAMNFPLSTAYNVSHKFLYAMASFSLNSKKSSISLFLPWPSFHWVECCSTSTWMLAFYYSCCSRRSALVCGDLIGCMELFQYFCICWVLFCDLLCDQFREGTMKFWEEGISFGFRIKFL
jgi:hypothetical protein